MKVGQLQLRAERAAPPQRPPPRHRRWLANQAWSLWTGHDHNHHADVDDLGHYHDYDVNGPDSAAFEATVLMLLTMTSAIW